MSAETNLKRGERRNVTVLFADMKGFTGLSEQMDPEEMDALMSRVFGIYESIIKSYGGTVEKYIGDALVAVFGVPELHEDDASRAVNASLDFLEQIDALNRRGSHRRDIEFRVGIHTGLITTGKRGEHEVVTGHAMAVASRLQSGADPGTILVSEATRRNVAHDFTFGPGRQVEVRGEAEVVTAYPVQTRKARPSQEDAVFVGRQQIIDRVFRDYLRHDPEKSDGYVITGPAGIGKTRVAQEVLARIGQLPNFDSGVLYARAQRYRTTPFSIVTDLLSGYFDVSDEMPVNEIAARLISDHAVDEKSAAGFAKLITSPGEEQDNQAFVLLYLILKNIVKKHLDTPYSTVLCIENLFFVDKSSLDFFAFFLRNADAKPFFLCTDRNPDAKTNETFGDLQFLELPALDRNETIELIRELAQEELDEEIVDSILANAAGNPLFIREYVRFAADYRDGGALPTTIQNIFLTSIDSYPQEYRDLLKKLSVFVHSFTIDDARHIHGVTEGEKESVAEAIDFFVGEGVLTHEGDLYFFRYDLFKKALYNSLLNYNKRILHKIVAELMQRAGNPHPFRLLHHLIRAEEFSRATETILEASNSGSNMDYLPFADELLKYWTNRDDGRQMSLMFLKSAILFNNGITGKIDSLLKSIIEMALRNRSYLYAGNAYHLLTAYNMKSYSFEKARFCGAKAIDCYAKVPGELRKKQNLLEIMATAETLRDNVGQADELVDEIRRLAGVDDAHFSEIRLVTKIAETQLLRGRYAEAVETLDAAHVQPPLHSESWYGAHLSLQMASFYRCNWERCLEIGRALLEGPSRHLSNISQIHARVGLAEHFLGETRAAERSLQQAQFNASQIRNDFDRIDALRTLASSLAWKGDHERAEQLALEGISAGLRHSASYPVLTLIMTLIAILEERDDREGVAYYMEEARHLVESGFLLSNRDLICYYYHQSLLDEKTANTNQARAMRHLAQDALRKEVHAIGHPEFADRFLTLPPFSLLARGSESSTEELDTRQAQ